MVILGRLALNPWWGRHHNRHLIFLPTVMLVAFLFGLGPGIVSAALCTAALAIFWREETIGEGFLRANSDLIMFALVGAAICFLVRSLHAARQRADAATESREQMLAIVAHDLRNPLNAVKLATDRVLRIMPESPPARRSLLVVQRAALRMDHLIRDLVDAKHIDQGALVVEPKAERCDGLAQEVVEIFTPQAQAHGLALEVANASSDGVVVCDRDRIMQAIGNLLGNAIKFTPEGGKVTLRIHDGGDAVRFEVEDNGPGIKPEHLPHIFERYWKGEARGIGLGLFIAKSIVHAHGGELRVQSQPAQGALFSFEIPRSPPPAEEPQRSA
jgi:signal transduction histidine kinase